MKAFKHIGIFLVAALVASSCGVSKVKDISLTSVGIQYIVPTSTRSMDAKLQLGINNPSIGFAVQEVTGTIKYQDKALAHFSTGGIQLEARSEQVYELPCSVVLDDNVSWLDFLPILSRGSLEGLTADVDIQAALKKNGVLRAPYRFRGLDISRFTTKK